MARRINSGVVIATQAVDQNSQLSTQTESTTNIFTGKTPTLKSSADRLLGIASDKVVIQEPTGVSSILAERSLSSLRPEIVTISPYVAHFDKTGRKTPAGALFDVLLEGRVLNAENLTNFISIIESDDLFERFIERLRNEYETEVEETREDIKALAELSKILTDTKRIFDLLQISQRLQAEVSSQVGARGAKPQGQFSTPLGILGCQLGFDKEKAEKFSNTKFVCQMIADLNNTLESYSPQLLSTFDSERKDDTDPIAIRRTLSSDIPFDYTIRNISSVSVDARSQNVSRTSSRQADNFSPTDFSNFSDFQDSLPPDPVDRAKVMLTSLSKELRISAGITRLENSRIDDRFNVNSEAFIRNILGNPGEKITDGVPSRRSLSSITRFETDDGKIVLPFESRLIIDPEEEKTFLPGSLFLVDSITKSDNFDTSALEAYSDSMSDAIDDAVFAISRLMNFNDNQERLYYAKMLQNILSFIDTAISSLGTDSVTLTSQSIGAALIKAASKNVSLKKQLLDYTLSIRAGDYVGASTTTSGGGGGRGGRGAGQPTTIQRPNSFGEEAEETADSDDRGTVGLEGFTESSEGISGANPKKFNTSKKVQVGQTISNGKPATKFKSNSSPQAIQRNVRQQFNISKRRSSSASSSANRDSSFIEVTDEKIVSVLIDVSDNENFIFPLIADYADKLLSDAVDISEIDNNSPRRTGIKDANNLTKRSGISDDTLVLLLFEIVSALFEKFVDARFTYEPSNEPIKIEVNKRKTQVFLDKARKIISGRSKTNTLAAGRNATISGALQSLYDTLVAEDALVKDQISMFRAIKSAVTSQTNVAVNFFSLQDNNTAISRLNRLSSLPEGRGIISNISEAQVKIMHKAFQDLMLPGNESLLPNSDLITETEENSVRSLTKSAGFTGKESENLKLLSVGLPANTAAALRNPVFRVGEDTEIRTENTDIVTIKVYRVDPEFEDLVLEPQSFVFDYSRFPFEMLPADPSIPYSSVAGTIYGLSDIDPQEGIGLPETVNQLETQIEYENLSREDIISMTRNHVNSEMIRLYFKVMTGVDLSETTFISDDVLESATYTEEAQDFLERFLRQMEQGTSPLDKAGVPTGPRGIEVIRLMLEGASYNSAASYVKKRERGRIAQKSILRKRPLSPNNPNLEINLESTGTPTPLDQEKVEMFRRLVSTVYFNKDFNRLRTLYPKAIERVFNIPLDPDDFIIDEVATSQTEAGRTILNSNKFRQCTFRDEEGNLKLIQREVEFSEYFVTVSLGVEL